MIDARTRESYRAAATIVACLVLGACSEDKPERAIPTLDAEYAGCAAVYAGPVCTLTADAREIVFWAEVPRGTAFRVRAGDEALAAAQEYIEGGVQVRATIPVTASEVVLERMESNEVASAFKLPIRPDDTPTEITEALALRGEGKFDEAEAKIQPLLESEDELVKTRARSTLARIQLTRGNHERAAEIFEATSDKLYQLGAISLSIHDSFALSHTRTYQQWRFADAERALTEASSRTSSFALGGAGVPLYQAQVRELLGDMRAIGLLQVASTAAARVGLTQMQSYATALHALVLLALGRFDESAALFESGMPLLPELAPCDRADYLTNLGWSRLVEAETRATAWPRTRRNEIPDARQPLEAALREYTSACERAASISNARVNLALAAVQRNDIDEAARQLAAAQRDSGEWTNAWATLLQARIARARNDASVALQKYDELIARASAAGAFADLWRARVGRSQTLLDQGRTREAAEELQLAEEAIDELTLRVALGDGREAFAGERDLSARLLATTLVALGEPERALIAARHARRRALRSAHRAARLSRLDVSTRERWLEAVNEYWETRRALTEAIESAWTSPTQGVAELAASQQEVRDRLSQQLDASLQILENVDATEGDDAPAPEETLLMYFPGEHSWIGFAWTGGEITTASIEAFAQDSSPALLSARLLSPFEIAIAQATRARIITYGALDQVEFASLPWRGRMLLESLEVVYAVDLRHDPHETPIRTALLVSDSRGDLPEATREAEAVRDRLEARGLQVDWYSGDDAILGTVAPALGRADIFHYAGHGRRAGRANLESHLPLAQDTELTLGDVLALPSVPREVILAACETGGTDDGVTGVPGMSLARAFVAGGADSVVAASGPVPDAVAARFSQLYHEARESAGPAASFRSAALAIDLRAQVAYRMYVP